MIGDEHWLPDRQVCAQRSVRVGQRDDPGTQSGGRADTVNHRPRSVPLVEMRPPGLHQHRAPVQVVGEQLASVAFGDRHSEVRDVGGAEPFGRRTPGVDGGRPARAEHDEGVVRRPAGAPGDVRRRLARLVDSAPPGVRID